MASRPRGNIHPLTPSSLKAAAARIRRGELVAFPTETVYGLGANALDAKAVAKIFAAKGRPEDNPLIVHVADRTMLRRVARRLPPLAEELAARFWPGPLTLVLSKKPLVPSIVTAGLGTVAVRIPEGMARDLVAAAGVPIAAPSANVSGRPSPTTARHVAEDFPALFVLDGGPTKHGVESTVIALDPFRILREGAIPGDFLRKVIGDIEKASGGARGREREEIHRGISSKVNTDGAMRRRPSSSRAATVASPPSSPSKKNPRRSPSSSSNPALSPGTKHAHYRPSRPLILFRRKSELVSYAASHPGALVLCPARLVPLFPKRRVLSLGSSPEEIAHNLFAGLRTRRRGTELLVLAVPRRGLGRTIMDRLERAAVRVVA